MHYPLKLPIISRFGLGEASARPFVYGVKAALVAFLPMLLVLLVSQAVAYGVMRFSSNSEAPLPDNLTNIEPSTLGPWFDLLNLVVLTPFLETILLALIIEVLLKMTTLRERVVWFSAAGWAVLHGALGHWLWGVLIGWAFVVFSASYVVWRQRSRRAAFGMAWLVHMLNNLPGSLIFVLNSH